MPTHGTLAIIAMKMNRKDEAEEAMSRYRGMTSQKPYGRRECEGLKMLLEVFSKLSGVNNELTSIIKELVSKGLSKARYGFNELNAESIVNDRA